MKVTSNQPEPVKQRIYGSTPVRPLDGVSNQPEVLPHTKVYGGRSLATIRVTVKASRSEAIINETDFDPALHEPLPDL